MKSKGAGGLPFASSVGDSIELMKRMWGMAGLPSVPGPGDLASMAVRLPSQLPSMVAPTLDIEELDKRITDLRAVEQWLELNAGLLRTTIQTLEVQRATISTLKSFSGAMLAPMMMGKGVPAMSPATQPPPMPSWAMPPAAQAVSPPPVAPPSEPAPEPRAPRKRRKPAATLRAVSGEPPLNPTAWWNTLQDQFSKIAAAAVAPPPSAEVKEKPAKPARKRAAKKRRR
jgi:hypothetical protein